MFRISRYMKTLLEKGPLFKPPAPSGPVVIWNLVRRCNLVCKHCYSISADKDFPGELNTSEVFDVMDDLKAFGAPVLILSGGEPLLRPDIYEISKRAKDLGFYIGLSTNGTLINENNIQQIADVGYDYLGISIDGLQEKHDQFRRKEGAFTASMHAVDLCRENNIKVGLRFTLTQDNFCDLPGLLALVKRKNIDKFYLSHLNYSGRGYSNRRDDAYYTTTRKAMDLLFNTCWQELQNGEYREYVTGNNDADAIYLLNWARQHVPDQVSTLHKRLEYWGGNSSGINISNIDNLGNVHPDTFWWNYPLGNVKETPFSEIWKNTQDPLMLGLRESPRPVKGRCGQCQYLSICGGNTRVRAYQLTKGDFWAEDPGCYLSNTEIGLEEDDSRIEYASATPIQFYKHNQEEIRYD